MVRPNFSKWKQTERDIYQMSQRASHPRTRERLMALYLIGTGLHTATTCAQFLDRTLHTILKWVHTYNEHGAQALTYQQTGGRASKLSDTAQASIIETV